MLSPFRRGNRESGEVPPPGGNTIPNSLARGTDAEDRGPSARVEAFDRCIERRGEDQPEDVREHQQSGGLAKAIELPRGGSGDGRHQEDHDLRQPDIVGREEQGRPGEIEHELDRRERARLRRPTAARQGQSRRQSRAARRGSARRCRKRGPAA